MNIYEYLKNFISNANTVHNNKYDYSLVEYRHSQLKVKIICREHGIFEQTPNNHLNRSVGCPQCNNRVKCTSDFIQKANKLHANKYDYSLVEYTNTKTKVKIVCKDHGVFEQVPNDHLNKNGCTQCGYRKSLAISKSETEWLTSFNNPNLICQYRIDLLDGRFVKVDAYDPITNTVYEYHGKYWHGHPDRSDPDYIIRNKSAGDRYIETLTKEIRLKEMGYTVVSKWA